MILRRIIQEVSRTVIYVFYCVPGSGFSVSSRTRAGQPSKWMMTPNDSQAQDLVQLDPVVVGKVQTDESSPPWK